VGFIVQGTSINMSFIVLQHRDDHQSILRARTVPSQCPSPLHGSPAIWCKVAENLNMYIFRNFPSGQIEHVGEVVVPWWALYVKMEPDLNFDRNDSIKLQAAPQR
jgi:hypothetical protein